MILGFDLVCVPRLYAVALLLDRLTNVATVEVKKHGVFTVPGLARLRIRTKPERKAGKIQVCGKSYMVKAKAAAKIVKAKPVGRFAAQFKEKC